LGPAGRFAGPEIPADASAQDRHSPSRAVRWPADGSALGSEPWHGPLRRHRGRIIVILARQLADANQRLGSSYWTGADGHNVGRVVYQAYGIALGVARRARSLVELTETLIAASATYRGGPGDPDG
jgi:hypothetical protein